MKSNVWLNILVSTQVFKDGKCAASDKWAHYDLGCQPRPNRKDACWRPLLRNIFSGELSDVRNPQVVKASVNSIIVF